MPTLLHRCVFVTLLAVAAAGILAGQADNTIEVNAIDGLEYVWIPPGTFMMGCVPGDTACHADEKPRHRVTISSGFWMSRWEVTVEAYKKFASATERSMPPAPSFNESWEEKKHPINRVTWSDAETYCKWAGGRLPTEAEWEYAARGGREGLKYPIGNELTPQGARFRANGTAPVGQYPANGYGLHDMSGNVREWVGDWYAGEYYQNSPSADPPGPASGQPRVVRGGAWYFGPRLLRASFRFRYLPDNWSDSIGFRCAREVSP